MNNKLDFSFLDAKASDVAPQILGSIIKRRIGDTVITVKIVETEAYDQTDAASHSYNGITERSRIMFGPAGYLYVYFTYGMHYCCNIVVGKQGEGAAVLIRAVEPITGLQEIVRRRPNRSGVSLTNGPAKLCQALDIDQRLNGHNLKQDNLQFIPKEILSEKLIVKSTRIGIKKSIGLKWRFYIKDNPYVSKI